MKTLLISSIILLTNCAVAGAADNPENVPPDVNYCDLAKNPSAFSGKRVRVRAIYSYMFEVSRLKPPACCSEGDLAVWVDFNEKLDRNSKRLFHKFPKGMGFVLATFEGVFQGGGPFGDGGYHFKLAVDKIEALENKASPPPAHRPAWIPNCAMSGRVAQSFAVEPLIPSAQWVPCPFAGFAKGRESKCLAPEILATEHPNNNECERQLFAIFRRGQHSRQRPDHPS